MPDPQQPDPAHAILAPLSGVPDSVKAMAWDAFQQADQKTFETRIGALPIPKEAKAQLWDAKFKTPAAPATPPGTPLPQTGDAIAEKATSIGPPETWGAYAKRQAHAVGHTLVESIPLLGAAAGGAVGATLGAPTAAVSGPVGPATTGVLGAGIGGFGGRIVQDYIRHLIHGTPAPPVSQEIGAAGREATTQMETQMGGEIMASPLGFLRRGGFTPMSNDVAQTVADNAKYGTRLSGPELATGTASGNIARQIQSYAGGAFGGNVIQSAARAEGGANATKALDSAVRVIATPMSRVQAGEAASGGIAAAKTGLQATGKQLDQIIESAPKVEMGPLKDQAYGLFQTRVLPLIQEFPDVAGSPKVAALLRDLKDQPDLVQRLPRPVMTQLADAVLEKTNSPVVKLLRTIMGAEDQVSFKGATQMRTLLRKAGSADDTLLPTKEATGIAKQFESAFRDVLFQTSPAYAKASPEYAQGAQLLGTKAVKTIYNTALTSPETVVDYLKRDTPTRAKLLRQALLDQASKGPDAQRAAAAFDVIRATWWQDAIVGKDDFAGMAKRLKTADSSGVLKELFADPKGQQLLQNGRAVANLMEKRTPVMAGNIRKIFEIGRIITAGMSVAGAAAGGHSIPMSAAASAATWEGAPDFFTWVIHNPKATEWFVQGVKAENPVQSSAAIVRLMELYRRTQPAKQAPDATATPAR